MKGHFPRQQVDRCSRVNPTLCDYLRRHGESIVLPPLIWRNLSAREFGTQVALELSYNQVIHGRRWSNSDKTGQKRNFSCVPQIDHWSMVHQTTLANWVDAAKSDQPKCCDLLEWSITRLFTKLPMSFSVLDNQCMQGRKCRVFST